MSRPIISLKSHPIQVAVWENTKEGRTYYSTKLTKRYKDEGSGEWKNTEYLSKDDLLKAAKLLCMAWQQIAVKDTAGSGAAPAGNGTEPSGDEEKDVPF